MKSRVVSKNIFTGTKTLFREEISLFAIFIEYFAENKIHVREIFRKTMKNKFVHISKREATDLLFFIAIL